MLIGAELMEEALPRASAPNKKKLKEWIALLRDEEHEAQAIAEVLKRYGFQGDV